MTKKDFEFIARVLNREYDMLAEPATITRVMEDFADRLGDWCPKFKHDVFLKACGHPKYRE